MRGSRDILAAVDCHVAITRDDKKLTLTQTKSRDSEELSPIELEVISTDGALSIEFVGTVQRPESKASKARSAIIGILTREPSLNQKQLHDKLIEDEINIGEKTLRNVLQELSAENVLNKSAGYRNTNLYQLNLDLSDE